MTKKRQLYAEITSKNKNHPDQESTGNLLQPASLHLTLETAIVTMIQKLGKDPKQPTSLLSYIGKQFERIITTRLTQHTENMGLLGIHQVGFCKNRSTTYDILRIRSNHTQFHEK